MNAFLRLYRYLNILSLDVVAGAIICALFFAKLFQVQIRIWGLLALGLTVWVIYTTDHLRDAKKIKHQASTERHRFHQRNFKILTLVLGFGLLLDAGTIVFIRKQVFEWGLLLFIGVLTYLIVQRSLLFLKEFFIAALYTCGVLILSLSITPLELAIGHYLLILQFAFVAWINLLLFSWFDQHYDETDEQRSFVTIMGKRATVFFLYGLFSLGYLLTLIQLTSPTPAVPVLILFVMHTVLFMIFIFRNSLRKDDLYRIIGDGVFIIPILYLL